MRILTFDIEEWFHLLDHESTRTEDDWSRFPARIEQNTVRILDLLDRHDQKATFFCLGWIARHHPGVIAEIVRRGHEIACHSDAHQLVYEMDRNAFREDLLAALDVLHAASGRPVSTYRAPGFSVKPGCEWFFDELVKAGISTDCSVFPAARAHGGFRSFGARGPARIETANGPLRELPMTTASCLGVRLVYSGGGYFRLLPLVVLRALFRRQDYVMTYFHPRDFDPAQPVIEGLSAVRRFRSYYGLGSALAKLDVLLSELDFIDVSTALERIDWDSVPVVRISS